MMINGFWRLMTTGFIWLMVAIVLVESNPVPGELIWMTLVLCAAAAYSTRFIWRDTTQVMPNQQEKAIKTKRNNRVSRLMDLLDEDEVADMEAWMDARQERRLNHEELAHYEQR